MASGPPRAPAPVEPRAAELAEGAAGNDDGDGQLDLSDNGDAGGGGLTAPQPDVLSTTGTAAVQRADSAIGDEYDSAGDTTGLMLAEDDAGDKASVTVAVSAAVNSTNTAAEAVFSADGDDAGADVDADADGAGPLGTEGLAGTAAAGPGPAAAGDASTGAARDVGGGGGGTRACVLDTAVLSANVAALLEQMGDGSAGPEPAEGAEGEPASAWTADDQGGQGCTTAPRPAPPAAFNVAMIPAEEAAAAAARALALIAAALERLQQQQQPQQQQPVTSAAPDQPVESPAPDSSAAAAAAAAATAEVVAVAPAPDASDAELVEGCRLVRSLCRGGQAAALQEGGCAVLLMRVGAAAGAADSDRAEAFAAVSELCSGGPKSSRGARAVAEAATADVAGPRALVECLSRWATDGSEAAAPLAAAALRAAVALSASAGPLAALLRARLLPALAALLARGVTPPPLQRSAAAFLAALSAHSPLSRPMMAAGIHVLACRLVGGRSRPLAVRESCCDVISNLALGGGAGGGLGDREAQAALTAAGAGPGLTKMLSLRNVQALCRASDAIANMTVGAYVPAQNALSGSVAPLAGLLVSAVGPGGQPLLLAVKAARALGNTCQGHPPNQDTAVKANIMPVLVAWISSRSGPLVRSASATTANLVVGNSDATDAAVGAGLLQPLLILLMQPLEAPAAPPPDPQAAADGTSAAAAAADGGSSPNQAPLSVAVALPADLFERAAGLLSCLTAASPGLRTQLLRQSGLARLLVARLAGSPTPGVAMAVCGALNNLVSSADPEAQAELVRAGAVPLLLRLVYARHEGVLRRSCHCLGSIVMGQKALQDALVGPLAPGKGGSSSNGGGAAAANDTAEDGGDGGGKDKLQQEQQPPGAAPGVMGPGYPDLPTRLAGLMRAAAGGPEAPGGGLVGPPSPALAAEVARLCGALCFRSNAAAQLRLAQAGVLEALVALLRINHVPAVCQGLMAAANMAGGCPDNRRRLLAAGLATELQRLLRVRGEEVVGRAAYCAAVLADPGEPGGGAATPAAEATAAEAAAATSPAKTLAAGAAGASASSPEGQAGGLKGPKAGKSPVQGAKSGKSGKGPKGPKDVVVAAEGDGQTAPGPQAAAAVTTVAAAAAAAAAEQEDPRGALAAAGLVPPLVRCLRHPSTDVAARGVAALEALVRGHRANALLVASAGGIAQLAALMERAGAAAAASAAAASAAAAAASTSASATAATGLAGPAAGAVAAAAGQAVPTVSEAQQTVLWRRCVDLWAALGGPGALVRLLAHKAPAVVERAATLIRVVAEGSDHESQSRLRRASVAPPLLRACRHRHLAVTESALRAVEALAGCGDLPGAAGGAAPSSPAASGGSGTFRAQLVDAGALGVLQGLQGHKRAAIARLASQVATAMYVKPGAVAR